MSLFEPGELGKLQLRNRLVMAPLGRARADPDSRMPLPFVARYYAQRASAGLIITEACHIRADSRSRRGSAAIHSEEQIQAWKLVCDAVHAQGGRIFVQLFHLGRKALAEHDQPPPVAPSAIADQGSIVVAGIRQPFTLPRELHASEVQTLAADFATAASNAMRAGFDGVELHGANGFLIEQFLRTASNQRHDRYGGRICNRARFLLETVDAVAAAIGPERIGVRISPHYHGTDPAEDDAAALYGHIASALQLRRIAYLHLIESAHLPLARQLAPDLRKRFAGALILAEDYDQHRAEQALQQRRADYIAFGRLYIANPDLPERFRRGAPLNQPDPDTFHNGGERGYIDYPFLC